MRGLNFPLKIEGNTLKENSRVNSAFDDGIVSHIKMVLNSIKGDRIFRADFGLGLNLVFRNIEDVDTIKKEIAEEINKFVPGNLISESMIDVEQEDNRLLIRIPILDELEGSDEEGL